MFSLRTKQVAYLNHVIPVGMSLLQLTVIDTDGKLTWSVTAKIARVTSLTIGASFTQRLANQPKESVAKKPAVKLAPIQRSFA
jgi:hypothetical protein